MFTQSDRPLTTTVDEAASRACSWLRFRAVGRYIAIAWVLALVFGSLLPFRIKSAIGTTSALHRPFHVVAFGSATLLLLVFSKGQYQRLKVFLFVLASAVASEALEFWKSYHPLYSVFEWQDVRDDAYGICAALALAALLKKVGKNALI